METEDTVSVQWAQGDVETSYSLLNNNNNNNNNYYYYYYYYYMFIYFSRNFSTYSMYV